MQIIQLSSKDRLRNAAKSAALMFGLAVVSIAVPVFHFVLVPMFLMLSFVMGAMEYRRGIEVRDVKVKCEDCGTEVDMAARTSQDLIMKYCPGCNRQVTYRLPT